MKKYPLIAAGLLLALVVFTNNFAHASNYQRIYTGNFSSPASAVSAGQPIAGLIDMHGGVGSVSGGYLLMNGSAAGEPWVKLLYATSSVAELNQNITFRIPANPGAEFNYNAALRSHDWNGATTTGSTVRQQFYQFHFLKNSAIPSGVVHVGISTNSGSNTSLIDPSFTHDPNEAYDVEFSAEGSNPTTLHAKITRVSDSAVLVNATTTDSTADLQTPGYAGVAETIFYGQGVSGNTKYAALTIDTEHAADPLLGSISEGSSTVGTNIISVTPTGGVGPYTVALYGKTDDANWTPSSGDRLDTLGSVITAQNAGTYTFTHTVTVPGQHWYYKAVITDTASSSITAITSRINAAARSNYLIVRNRENAPGALPVIDTQYQNGVILAVVGNSFIQKQSDTNPYSNQIKTYLEANGVSTVYQVGLGFPGSGLGEDWGTNSAVFAPGGNGPNDVSYGSYGAVGNNSSKNLLANMIDRIQAAEAAHPGVPVVIVFYELTNSAQHGVAVNAIQTHAQEIASTTASHNWKLVWEGPAWFTPGSSNPANRVNILINGFNALKNNVSDNQHTYTGSDEFLYRSFVNSDDWFYGSGADGSGVHVTTAAGSVMGTVWAEQLRRNVLVLPADITPPVISSISSGAISTSGGTLTWTTNEAATSQVVYGTTSTYSSSTTADVSLVTSHTVSLSSLIPSTTYHFAVVSRDVAGNTSTSTDQTLTTSAPSVSSGGGSSGGGGGSSRRHSSRSSSSGSTSSAPVNIPTSTTNTTTTTTTSSPSSVSFMRDLTVGATGTDVTALQQWLIRKGFTLTAGATGYFGAETKAALARYQASAGITPASGYLGPITRTALSVSTAAPPVIPTTDTTASPVIASTSSTVFTRDLTVGATGTDVTALQQWLNAHGYQVAAAGPGSNGNETLVFGNATKAALMRYQIALGITPASGYFGPKTRAVLGTIK